MKLDLTAIKQRCEAATQGKWALDGMQVYFQSGEFTAFDINAHLNFLAHARTDVPALVAEVERLRRENVRLKKHLCEIQRTKQTRIGDPAELGDFFGEGEATTDEQE